MKTHHVLGSLWLLLCSCVGFSLLWQLFHSGSSSTATVVYVVVGCLLYLSGALASIFLIRGARWARIFVGLVAALTIIVLMIQRPLPWGVIAVVVFAFASVVLLFWPRHEPVA
jgi:hypothetical protein